MGNNISYFPCQIWLFIFHGFLGGVLWILVHWKWDKRNITQHTVVSAIAGYIYWILHNKYACSDSFMAIIVGYFSVDFIKQITSFFGKK